jgi:lysozyme
MNLLHLCDKRRRTLLALVLTIAVLAGFALPHTGNGFQNVKFSTLPAVHIKTQAAADSIPGGITGIDVSKYQGNINWAKVADDDADIKFAFIRASIGLNTDPNFVANAKAAAENGIKVGAYHYARFSNRATMLEEAKFFVKQLNQVAISYPVVLDLEQHGGGLNRTALTDLAVEFMGYVQKAGYRVMFYSYDNFYEWYLDKEKISAFPLWVANYVEHPKQVTPNVWQYSSYGSVSGISGRVDLNVAYSDLGTGRQVMVNKEISDSIKIHLNENYNAGIDIAAPLDYSHIETSLARGLQAEIIRQFGEYHDVDGAITRTQLGTLSTIGFSPETRGNITTLIQSRLFYKGYYTQPISGQFDSHTVDALAAYQRENWLRETRTMDPVTWEKLFPPVD